MAIRPAVGGERPKHACAISERPEPTSPAIPTISPARNANETLEKAPSRVSPSTRNLPSGRSFPTPGEHAFERTAHHHANDFRPRHFGGGPRRHMAPIAKDRDSVSDERQLLKPVGDEKDRGSMAPQVAHDAEKLFRLRWGQRRGGFVED